MHLSTKNILFELFISLFKSKILKQIMNDNINNVNKNLEYYLYYKKVNLIKI